MLVVRVTPLDIVSGNFQQEIFLFDGECQTAVPGNLEKVMNTRNLSVDFFHIQGFHEFLQH